MIIVPGHPPLQHTRHSREIGRRVEETLRDYQRDNPDVTENDVYAALTLIANSQSTELTRRRRVLAVAIAVLAMGAFTFMASTSGKGLENNPMVLRIVGVAVAVGAIAFAMIRLARRG